MVTFVVSYVVGEPALNAAIGLEPSDHAHGEVAVREGTQVSRTLQSTLGLLTGTTVVGVTLGGVLGVLSALAVGRFGGLSARASTLAVTAVGFGACYLLPTLAYPPNPPGVGRGETITIRTTLYFLIVAISVVAAVAAVLAGRALAPRWGSWYATMTAAVGYLVVTLIAVALLPTANEVPADYPAVVLYEFRRASFLTQLTLWAVLGVVLADLVHRLMSRTRQPAAAGPGAP